MKIAVPKNLNSRHIFIILVLVTGVIMPLLSLYYGLTDDQRFHQEHGERLLEYFKNRSDITLYSPLDEAGNFVSVIDGGVNELKGMNIFGGFFDLLTNFLHQYFPLVGTYEFRNIISSLFGFLMFLFCGLIAKEIGGWKAGIITLLFITLSPYLLGQSMMNPKDIPFAAFYVFSVFHIVKLLKELPVITIKRTFFILLNFSLLINIRLLGLVIFGIFFAAVLSWWIIKNYNNKFGNVNWRETSLIVIKTIGITILSYISIALFWPYIQTKPFTGVVELFIKLKDFNGFISTQLYEGQWANSHDMPWYYMIKSLFVLIAPVHILLGYLLIPVYLYYQRGKQSILLYSFVLFSSFFPLLLVLIGKPNSYDNGRHFMFIIPTVIIAIAIACNALLERTDNKKYKITAYSIILILLIEPLFFSIKNNRLLPLYFSPVIGGVEGAFKNYEIDYWGVGVKPAVDWLKDNVGSEESPSRVRLYYGEQKKLSYYTEMIPNLSYVAARQDSPDWEYSIVMLSEAKHNWGLLENWPPNNTVYEVKVDDVTICAVTKNDFVVDEYTRLEQRLAKNPNAPEFVQLSLLYFKKGDYFKSIEASLKAIKLNSSNIIAYNNLGASYNTLLMYDKAKEALGIALLIDPDFDLALNNMKIAEQGMERRKKKDFSEQEYLALSFNYYTTRNYKDCIKVSEELLSTFPNNATAYNNICISYNNIGEWKKAIKACENALRINSDFELAKNNLEWAKSKIDR
ncbi:tetratricopeptide repeat protein [uncultured Aquimarina sp.]|uniref:tetratricopeptide repeat protein n=1 Tax=uncultured Aquimarina sp. TaxID=575652 RepID=UPI0026040BDB|nr:tetratricopeptide repeat protein [uncultured Aquimarina sp.]